MPRATFQHTDTENVQNILEKDENRQSKVQKLYTITTSGNSTRLGMESEKCMRPLKDCKFKNLPAYLYKNQ